MAHIPESSTRLVAETPTAGRGAVADAPADPGLHRGLSKRHIMFIARGTALGPAHTLAQSAFFRTRNVSRHVDGLYYAGASTIPGIGLPMCLISAELVLKHVRGDTGTAPVAEPGGGTVFDR